MGPSIMLADRLTYNDAIQYAERQEFLLDLGAAAGADVGDDQQQRMNLFNIGGAIGYSERPKYG